VLRAHGVLSGILADAMPLTPEKRSELRLAEVPGPFAQHAPPSGWVRRLWPR